MKNLILYILFLNIVYSNALYGQSTSGGIATTPNQPNTP